LSYGTVEGLSSTANMKNPLRSQARSEPISSGLRQSQTAGHCLVPVHHPKLRR